MKSIGNSALLQFVSLCLVSTALPQRLQAQQFLAPVSYPTDSPFSVATGDFNLDGIPDLVVANAYGGPGKVTVYLGNGDGTFQAGISFETGGTDTYKVAVGDFNGDGKPDLVVSNGSGPIAESTGNVGILLGNGDGTFKPVVNYGAGILPESVSVGDLNGDGKLDVVVANNENSVSILLGKGDGTFAPAVDYPTELLADSVAIADFNGDGKLDLAVTNTNSRSVSILLGKGDGTFEAATNFAAGAGPEGIATGDFNGDGKLDLAVANFGESTTPTVSVLMGNGDGTFQAPVNYPAGVEPTGVVVADINGDGKVDLIVANSGGLSDGATIPEVYVLLGKGDGTFEAATTYLTGLGATAVIVADLNSDGLPDVAVAGLFDNALQVLLSAGESCMTPPDIDDIRARPDLLWPSNRLELVDVRYRATSHCGGQPICTLSVSANEELSDRDFSIVDPHHVKLRAKRSDRWERWHEEGLKYTIEVSCKDPHGNKSQGRTVVRVLSDHDGPHRLGDWNNDGDPGQRR